MVKKYTVTSYTQTETINMVFQKPDIPAFREADKSAGCICDCDAVFYWNSCQLSLSSFVPFDFVHDTIITNYNQL